MISTVVLDHLWEQLRALRDARDLAACISLENGRTYIFAEFQSRRVELYLAKGAILTIDLMSGVDAYGLYQNDETIYVPLDDPALFEKAIATARKYLNV